MPTTRSTDQRFLLIFFPVGHMAVDWGGAAVLLLAPAMAMAMDLSVLQVGFLLTAMQLGSGLAYAPAGLLGDRVHRRGLLLLASFWWVAIGYLAASFAPGYWALVALLTLAMTGAAAWHPVATGVMVERMAERKAQALGVHVIGGEVAHVLAPLSVGFLLTYLSWQHVLQISVMPALVVGIVLLWWWRRIPPSGRERIGREDLRAMWSEWRRPAGLSVAAMLVTYQTSFVALEAMTPLFLVREHDYTLAVTGAVFAAMLAGGALASPFVGRVSDTAGRRPVAIVALAGAGAAGIVAAFAAGGPLLIGGLVLAGTLIVSVRSVMLATAVDVSKGHESTALGVAFSIMDGVGAMGALAAGAIGMNDLRLAIAFAAAMAFVSLGVAMVTPSRHASRAREVRPV